MVVRNNSGLNPGGWFIIISFRISPGAPFPLCGDALAGSLIRAVREFAARFCLEVAVGAGR